MPRPTSSIPPPSSLRIPHPTLDMVRYDDRLAVHGTFKGKLLTVRMRLAASSVSVDWSFLPVVLDGSREVMASPREVNELLEDLVEEVGSFLFKTW